MPQKAKQRVPSPRDEIVLQYFRCIDKKDVEGALSLFDDDAVVYEPFSNVRDGLRGRHAIEPFLKVAMMANSNFKRIINLEGDSVKKNEVTALVTFEKGDKTRGRFTFEFAPPDSAGVNRIKKLHIEF